MTQKEIIGVPTLHFVIRAHFKDEQGSLRSVVVDEDIVTAESFELISATYSVNHIYRWHNSRDLEGWDFKKEHFLGSFVKLEDAEEFAKLKHDRLLKDQI